MEFKDQSYDIKSMQRRNTGSSNIGDKIAGVVGEGAIKLQALQKWFKGEKGDGSDLLKQDFRRR